MLALLVTTHLAVAPAAPAVEDPPAIALEVDQVLTGTGESIRGGFLVMRGGKVAAVGAAQAPEGAWVLRFEGATASPALIDPVTGLGSPQDLFETARAFTPEADAAEALNPGHSQFQSAAEAGLGLVGLSPTSNNIVGGRIAAVATRGAGEQAELVGAGPMRLSLIALALEDTRKPTSRMGAAAALREWLAGGGSEERAMVIDARTPDEIRLALDLLTGGGRRVSVFAPSDPRAVDLLRASGASAIVGPFGLSTSARTLRLPAQMAEKGIPVAFTAGGNAATLRLTAAMAVRSGMDPESALAGLTRIPAEILGLAGSAGTLEVGRRADVVVWSGHPLDLTARPLAVFLGGNKVHLSTEEDR